MVELTQWLQYLVNGVSLGAILALAAIGLTLVYGILNLANFAHGDLLTLGAYGVLFFAVGDWWGYENLLPVGFGVAAVLAAASLLDRFTIRRLTPGERWTTWGFAAALAVATGALWLLGPGGAGSTPRVLLVATLLAIAVTVVASVAFELAIFRPLRKKRSTILSLVIASLGLSLVIRAGLQIYFGGIQRFLRRPIDPAQTYFGVSISDEQILTLVVTVVLIVLVHLFLTRSRTGKAMRALADNRDLARVCGIDVDRIILYVWAIAGALVAVAGLMLTLIQNNNVNLGMGFGFLIPIFASVVLGGVGSPYGAMAGGLIVGVSMRIVPAEHDLAAAFAVLIVVLLVRPQGIFGVRA